MAFPDPGLLNLKVCEDLRIAFFANSQVEVLDQDWAEEPPMFADRFRTNFLARAECRLL